MAAAQIYPFNAASASAQQVLKNHLEFVPAKTPEAVTIKPSKYIVVGTGAQSSSSSSSASSLTPAASSSPSSPVTSSQDSTPGTSPDSSDSEHRKKLLVQKTEFYGLNDIGQDSTKKRICKTWRGVVTPPTGLVNTGVTCFMNSAIQIMLHVPALVHYLNSVRDNKVPELAQSAKVTRDLAELFTRLSTKRREFVPGKMIKNLDLINCMMTPYQQQDSHEYFQSLLGRLQEESTPKGQKLNTSIIHDIFGGSLHQTIQCNHCGHVSTTYQDLYDLALQFSSSLVKAVHEYFKDEKMDGYTCEKCKKSTSALKKSSIEEAPEYLTVHIKRFKHISGHKYHKEKNNVSYPLDLKLSQYASSSRKQKGGEPIQYRLIAVLVHSGRTTSSGHYVALCRQSSGQWAEYDDELVRQVSEREALNQGSAYMLMYARLTPKPQEPHSRDQDHKSRENKVNGSTPVKRSASAVDDIDKIFATKRRK